MSTTADFLVEIGTEELPPKALRDLEAAFGTGIRTGLLEAGLAFADLKSFSTPRRRSCQDSKRNTVSPSECV